MALTANNYLNIAKCHWIYSHCPCLPQYIGDSHIDHTGIFFRYAHILAYKGCPSSDPSPMSRTKGFSGGAGTDQAD